MCVCDEDSLDQFKGAMTVVFFFLARQSAECAVGQLKDTNGTVNNLTRKGTVLFF